MFKRIRSGVLALAAAASLLFVGSLLGASPAQANITNVETKVASGTANANSIKTLGVSCSSGKTALGGGVSFSNPAADVNVVSSVPSGATGDGSDNATGWLGEFNNKESISKTVYVWVICGTVS